MFSLTMCGRKTVACIGLALAIGIAQGALSAATLTVNSTGGADHTTIQAAYNAAASGDTISIVSSPHTEQAIAFSTAGKNVTVSGSGASSTLIVGGGTSRIFNITQGNVSFVNLSISNGVLTGTGGGIYYNVIGGVLTIDGCNIHNCRANSGNGGSVAIENGSATIQNSIFTNNSASSGGGIYTTQSVTALTVRYCTFTSNNAWNGGGMYLNNDSLTLDHCDVNYNTANSYGAVFVRYCNTGISTINDCNFNNNTMTGDSSFYSQDSVITYNRCNFNNNTTSAGHGGFNSYHGGTNTFNDCTFDGNTGTDRGGGMVINGISTFNRCTISNNITTGSAGGVSVQGGTATFNNCTISYNECSSYGAGVRTEGGTTYFYNCTVAYNYCGSYYGGILQYGGTAIVYGCIVSNNVAGTPNDLSGNLLVNYSLIQTPATFAGGSANNITGVDPDLAALADNGGYTKTMAITTASPAFNTGANGQGLTTDQRGSIRVSGGQADIGAFEVIAERMSLAHGAGDFTEGLEDGCQIIATLEYATFNSPLTLGNWTVENLPVGVTVGSAVYINATTARLTLSGNATVDYDTDIEDITVTCTEAETSHAYSITANTGVVLTALTESLAWTGGLSGDAKTFFEGTANDGSINNNIPIIVTLTNDMFSGYTNDDFVMDGKIIVTNCPASLFVAATRTGDTTIEIVLLGNADSHTNANDISNLGFEFLDSAFGRGGSTTIANSVITDAAIDFYTTAGIVLTHGSGEILEGAESGETINVFLEGAVFSSPLTAANWSISSGPAGVTIANATYIDGAHAVLTLGGNATADYDTNITNAQISCTAAETSSASGFSKNTGVTFTAVIETLTYSSGFISDGRTFREVLSDDGSINNTIPIIITLSGDTFTGNNGDDFEPSKVTVFNLPAGFTDVRLERTSPTTLAATILGNATNHTNADDISNLRFMFLNGAINRGGASTIANYNVSNLIVDYLAPDVYVSLTGNDATGTGEPGTPFLTIQKGIDIVAPGGTVHIADGTYTGVGNRDLRMNGKVCSVHSLNDNPALVIIDCETAARGFIFDNSETSGCRVYNLTIRNGNAPGFGSTGGGINILGSASPVIEGCIIDNCEAAGTSWGAGGGIFIETSASVIDCVIENCVSTGGPGAGIYIEGGSITGTTVRFCSAESWSDGGGLAGGSPLISNCAFHDNTSDGYGGGAYIENSEACAIQSSDFYNNSADYGGGLYAYGQSSAKVTVNDCQIYDNDSTGYGAGVYARYVDMTDCDIYGNVGTDTGGGLYLQYSTLMDSTVDGNTGYYGGGFYSSNSTIERVFVTNNAATNQAGGVRVTSSTLRNVLVAGNSATSNYAGVHCLGSSHLYNCTIAGNTTAGATGGIYGASTNSANNSVIYGNSNAEIGSTIVLNYCNIEGTVSGTNFNINPLFVGAGDYSVQRASPNINIANIATATTVDVLNNARDSKPDIGCYEYKTYSISGTVSGVVSSGVTITLSGDYGNDTILTDALGSYTFVALVDASWSVVPTASGYGFTPESRTVVLSVTSVDDADFVSSLRYVLSGTISGLGGAIIDVVLTGDASRTTTTDADGNYSFINLNNGSYTVTPTDANFTFTPSSEPRTVSGADVPNVNFSAASVQYSISGTIQGAVTGGVSLSLTGDDTQTTTSTAGTGAFTFMVDAGSFVITPTLAGYRFTPASTDVTVDGGNQTGLVFNAVRVYRVSGAISGEVTNDVPVLLSGAATGSTATDSSGNYEFWLEPGAYRLTPTLAGIGFDPEFIDVTVLASDSSGHDFISYELHTVGGQVTGPASANVVVTLSSVAHGDRQAIVNAFGFYTFNDVLNGDYTVTPSFSGFGFTPLSSDITVAGANRTDINFVSFHATYPAITSKSGISGTAPNQYVYLTVGDSLSGIGWTLSDATAGDNLTLTVEFVEANSDGYSVSPFAFLDGDATPGDGINESVAPAVCEIDMTGNAPAGASGSGPWTAFYRITGDDELVQTVYTLTVYITLPPNEAPTVLTGANVSGAFTNMTATVDLNGGTTVSGVSITARDSNSSDVLSMTFNYIDVLSTTPTQPAFTWTPGLSTSATGGSPTETTIALSTVTNQLGVFVWQVVVTDQHVSLVGYLYVTVIHSGNETPQITGSARIGGSFPDFIASVTIEEALSGNALAMYGTDSNATDTLTLSLVFSPVNSWNYLTSPLSFYDDVAPTDDGNNVHLGSVGTEVRLVGTLPSTPTGKLYYFVTLSDGLVTVNATLTVNIIAQNIAPELYASPSFSGSSSTSFVLTQPIERDEMLESAYIYAFDPNSGDSLTLTVTFDAGGSTFASDPFTISPASVVNVTAPTTPVIYITGSAPADGTARYILDAYDGSVHTTTTLRITVLTPVNVPPSLTPDSGVSGVSPVYTATLYKGLSAYSTRVGFIGYDPDDGQTLAMTMTFNASLSSTYAVNPFSFQPSGAVSSPTPIAQGIWLNGVATGTGTAVYDVSLSDGKASPVTARLYVQVLNRDPNLSKDIGVSGIYPNFTATVASGAAIYRVGFSGSDNDPSDNLTLSVAFNAGASSGFATNPFVYSPVGGSQSVTSPDSASVSLTGSAVGKGTAVYTITLTDGIAVRTATLTVTVLNESPTLTSSGLSRVGNDFTLNAQIGSDLTFSVKGRDNDSGDTITLTSAYDVGASSLTETLTMAPVGGIQTATAPAESVVAFSGNAGSLAGTFVYTLTVTDGFNTAVAGSLRITLTGSAPENNAPTIYLTGVSGIDPDYAVSATVGQTISVIGIYGMDSDSGDNLALTCTFSAGDSTGFAASPYIVSDSGMDSAVAPDAALITISGAATSAGVAVYHLSLDDGSVATPVTATLTITVTEITNAAPLLAAMSGLSYVGDDWVAVVNEGGTLANIGFYGYDFDSGDSLTLDFAFVPGDSTGYAVQPFSYDPVSGSATATSPSQPEVRIAGLAVPGTGAGPWIAAYSVDIYDGTQTVSATIKITVNELANTEPVLSRMSNVVNAGGGNYTANAFSGVAVANIGLTGYDSDAGDALSLTLAFNAGESTGFATDPFGRVPGITDTITTPGGVSVALSGAPVGAGIAVYDYTLTDGVAPAIAGKLTVSVYNYAPTLSAAGRINRPTSTSFIMTVSAGESISGDSIIGTDVNAGDALELSLAFNAGLSTGFASSPFTLVASPTALGSDPVTAGATAPTAASVELTGSASSDGIAVYDIVLSDGVSADVTARLTVTVNPANSAPQLFGMTGVSGSAPNYSLTVGSNATLSDVGFELRDIDIGNWLTLSVTFNAAASTAFSTNPYSFLPSNGRASGSSPTRPTVLMTGSTPTSGQAVYDIEYSDGFGTYYAALVIVVSPNQQPVINVSGLSGAGPDYVIEMTADETLGNYITFTGSDPDNGDSLSMAVVVSGTLADSFYHSQTFSAVAPATVSDIIYGNAPSTTGSLVLTYTVTDGITSPVSASLTVNVVAAPVNNPPSLQGVGTSGAAPHFTFTTTINQSVAGLQIRSMDIDSGDTVTLQATYNSSASTLPKTTTTAYSPISGQAVSPGQVSASFGGTSSYPGTIVYNLTVSDGAAIETGTLTIQFVDVPAAPVLAVNGMTSVSANEWETTVYRGDLLPTVSVIGSDANFSASVLLTLTFNDGLSTVVSPFSVNPNPSQAFSPETARVHVSGWAGNAVGVVVYTAMVESGGDVIIGKLTFNIIKPNESPWFGSSSLVYSGGMYHITVLPAQALSGISLNGIDSDAGDSLTLTLTYNAANSTLGNVFALTPNPATGSSPVAVSIGGTAPATNGYVQYDATLSDGIHPVLTTTVQISVDSSSNNKPILTGTGVSGGGTQFYYYASCGQVLSGLSINATDYDSGDTVTLTLAYNAGMSSLSDLLTLTNNGASGSPSVSVGVNGSVGTAAGVLVYSIVADDTKQTTVGTLTVSVTNDAPVLSSASGVGGATPNFTADIASGASLSNVTIYGSDSNAGDSLTLTLTFNAAQSNGYTTNPFTFAPVSGSGSAVAPLQASVGLTGSATTPGYVRYDISLTDGKTARAGTLTIFVGAVNVSPTLTAGGGISGVAPAYSLTGTVGSPVYGWVSGSDLNDGDSLSLSVNYNSGASTFGPTSPFTLTPGSTVATTAPSSATITLSGSAPFAGTAVYDMTLSDGLNAPVVATLTVAIAANVAPTLDAQGVGSKSGNHFAVSRTTNATLSGVSVIGSDSNAGDTLTLTLAYNSGLSTLPDIITVSPNPSVVTSPSVAGVGVYGSTGSTAGTIVYDVTLSDGINADVIGTLTINIDEQNLPPVLTVTGAGGSGPNYVINATVGDTLSGITATGTDPNAGDTLTLTTTYQAAYSTIGDILLASPNPKVGVSPASSLLSGSAGLTSGVASYRLTLSDGVHSPVLATLTINVTAAFVNTPPAIQCYGVTGTAPNWYLILNKNDVVSGVSVRGTDIDSGDLLSLNIVRNASGSTLGNLLSFGTLPATATAPASVNAAASGSAGTLGGQVVYDIACGDGTDAVSGTLTLIVLNSAPSVSHAPSMSGGYDAHRANATAGVALSNVWLELTDADAGDNLILTLAFNASNSSGFATDPFSLTPAGFSNAVAPSAAKITVSGTPLNAGIIWYDMTATDGEAVISGSLVITVYAGNVAPLWLTGGSVTGTAPAFEATVGAGQTLTGVGIGGYDPNSGNMLTLTAAYVSGPATFVLTPASGTDTAAAPGSPWIEFSGSSAAVGNAVYNVTLSDGIVPVLNATLTIRVTANNTPTLSAEGFSGAFPNWTLNLADGDSYNGWFIGSDADTGDSLTLSVAYQSGTLGDIVTLTPAVSTATAPAYSAVIVSGIAPRQTGSAVYAVTLSDVINPNVTGTLTINVVAVNHAPVLSAQGLSGDPTTGYSLNIQAGSALGANVRLFGYDADTGDTLTLTAVHSSGTDALTFNGNPNPAVAPNSAILDVSSGALSAGTIVYAITLSDGVPADDVSTTLTINVSAGPAPNNPPSLAGSAGLTLTGANQWALTLHSGQSLPAERFTGSDADAAYSLALTATHSSGAAFATFSPNPSTASAPNNAVSILSGVAPSAPGASVYSLTLTDGTPVDNVSGSFTITVVNDAPALTGNGTGLTGDSTAGYALTLPSGGTLPSLRFALSDPNAGDSLAVSLTFNASSSTNYSTTPFIAMPSSGSTATSPSVAEVFLSGIASSYGVAVYDIDYDDGVGGHSGSTTLTVTVTHVNSAPTLNALGFNRSGNDFTLSVPANTVMGGQAILGDDSDSGDALTLTLTHSSGTVLTQTPNPNPSVAPLSARVELSGNVGATAGVIVYALSISDGTATTNGTLTITVGDANTPPALAGSAALVQTGNLFETSVQINETLPVISVQANDLNAGDTLTLNLAYDSANSTLPNALTLTASPITGATSVSVSVSGDSGSLAGQYVYSITASDGVNAPLLGRLTIRVLSSNVPPTLATDDAAQTGDDYYVTYPSDAAVSVALRGTDLNTGDTLTLSLEYNAGASTVADVFALTPVGGVHTAIAPSIAAVTVTGNSLSYSGLVVYDYELGDGQPGHTLSGQLIITLTGSTAPINNPPSISALTGVSGSYPNYTATVLSGETLSLIGFRGTDIDAGDSLTLTVTQTGGPTGVVFDPVTGAHTAVSPAQATVDLTGAVSAVGVATFDIHLSDGTAARNATLTLTVQSAATYTLTGSISISGGLTDITQVVATLYDNLTLAPAVGIAPVSVASNGSLSFANVPSGTYYVVYTAADFALTPNTTSVFTVPATTIIPDIGVISTASSNGPPVLTMTGASLTGAHPSWALTTTVGTIISLSANSTDASASDTLTLTVAYDGAGSTLPETLTLTPGAGIASAATPTTVNVGIAGNVGTLSGTYVYSLTASDGVNTDVAGTLTITVVGRFTISGSLSVTGDISDPTQIVAVLYNAATNLPASGASTATPDATGAFQFVNVVLGDYYVVYAATGYSLSPNQTPDFNVPGVLSVPGIGAITATVNVTNTSPSLSLTGVTAKVVTDGWQVAINIKKSFGPATFTGSDLNVGDPLALVVSYDPDASTLPNILTLSPLDGAMGTTSPTDAKVYLFGNVGSKAGRIVYRILLTDGVNAPVERTLTIVVRKPPAPGGCWFDASHLNGSSRLAWAVVALAFAALGLRRRAGESR